MSESTDAVLSVWGENIAIQRQALNEAGKRREPHEPPLTQKGLGELLDPPVHQTTVARWESGDMEPRLRYKQQLADVLGVDIRVLFSIPALPKAAGL